jgi:hypothetical protein
MECLLAAIFILILVAVPMAALGLSLWPSPGEEALKQVARRFGGAYYRGGWFRPPRVTIRYGAASAILRMMRAGGRSWAELSIYGTKPGVRLELAPASDNSLRMLEHDRALNQVTPVTLDPIHPYVAYAEHKYDADRFLTDAVMVQLKVLQRWGDAASLVVAVEPGEIVVRKQWTGSLRVSEPIIEFVQMAMRLHDHILLGKEKGIEFLAPVQNPVEHVKCAVCGEPMGGEYVSCRTCSAPHHLECWKYNGSCAMFACKEIRYEIVRVNVKKNVRWQ